MMFALAINRELGLEISIAIWEYNWEMNEWQLTALTHIFINH